MKRWVRHAVVAIFESNLTITGLLLLVIKKPCMVLLDKYAPAEEK